MFDLEVVRLENLHLGDTREHMGETLTGLQIERRNTGDRLKPVANPSSNDLLRASASRDVERRANYVGQPAQTSGSEGIVRLPRLVNQSRRHGGWEVTRNRSIVVDQQRVRCPRPTGAV